MVNQMVASRHVAQTISLLLKALGQLRLYLLIKETKSVHLSVPHLSTMFVPGFWFVPHL